MLTVCRCPEFGKRPRSNPHECRGQCPIHVNQKSAATVADQSCPPVMTAHPSGIVRTIGKDKTSLKAGDGAVGLAERAFRNKPG